MRSSSRTYCRPPARWEILRANPPPRHCLLYSASRPMPKTLAASCIWRVWRGKKKARRASGPEKLKFSGEFVHRKACAGMRGPPKVGSRFRPPVDWSAKVEFGLVFDTKKSRTGSPPSGLQLTGRHDVDNLSLPVFFNVSTPPSSVVQWNYSKSHKVAKILVFRMVFLV